ncbi:hypothetical protein BSKO_10459 [Bryopsis sp. KO-2023]|nr:hypothetical protein BSKO_10459 [Bryopsis sp. KO-2023]
MAASACSLCVTGGVFVQRPAPVPCCRHSAFDHNRRVQKLGCRASGSEADNDAEERDKQREGRSKLSAERDGAVSRRDLFKWGALSVIATESCIKSPAEAAGKKGPSWGYEYENGPTTWGGVCKTGVDQSPVDFEGVQKMTGSTQAQFKFNYTPETNATVINTGHGTMQVNFPPGQTCTLGDRELELLQFHFHAPSEHSMDGVRGAMEVHLVHKDKATGGLAVLGSVMTVKSFSNPVVAKALSDAPEDPGEPMPVSGAINLMKLLPEKTENGHRPFMHYIGSLTTPPCSESVDWFVFKDPVSVSPFQVLDFQAFLTGGESLGRNSRPLQALGDRPVTFFGV